MTRKIWWPSPQDLAQCLHSSRIHGIGTPLDQFVLGDFLLEPGLGMCFACRQNVISESFHDFLLEFRVMEHSNRSTVGIPQNK